MPTMMKTLVMMSWISLLLTGCATGSKDSILPQDGPTMKEVYDNHFNGTLHQQGATSPQADGRETVITDNIVKSRLRSQYDAEELPRYTREAHNEINNIFPRLKNKTLIMYVFPHLSSSERNPVPGYSTAFTLYEKTEYALPGEQMEGY